MDSVLSLSPYFSTNFPKLECTLDPKALDKAISPFNHPDVLPLSIMQGHGH